MHTCSFKVYIIIVLPMFQSSRSSESIENIREIPDLKLMSVFLLGLWLDLDNLFLNESTKFSCLLVIGKIEDVGEAMCCHVLFNDNEQRRHALPGPWLCSFFHRSSFLRTCMHNIIISMQHNLLTQLSNEGIRNLRIKWRDTYKKRRTRRDTYKKIFLRSIIGV